MFTLPICEISAQQLFISQRKASIQLQFSVYSLPFRSEERKIAANSSNTAKSYLRKSLSANNKKDVRMSTLPIYKILAQQLLTSRRKPSIQLLFSAILCNFSVKSGKQQLIGRIQQNLAQESAFRLIIKKMRECLLYLSIKFQLISFLFRGENQVFSCYSLLFSLKKLPLKVLLLKENGER